MFLDENFLLTNAPAKKLFNDYASKMPIIDYHCHLDPSEIYEDKNFKNITAAWLYGDHYKWRLMRANGVPESHVTGDASDYDKFLAWAATLPKAIGNPVYEWTHLELRRFFDVEETLTPESAPAIWEKVNAKLASKDFSRRNLIRNSNVKILCTTDDPIDDLRYHKLLAAEEETFRVLPTFRPDKALNIDAATFLPWIASLSEVIGSKIDSFAALKDALKSRVKYFTENGGKLSDHAIDVLNYKEGTEAQADAILKKALAGETLCADEVALYRTELFSALIKMYHEFDWTMQIHFHAFRNNNTLMFNKIGPDTGFDSVNDSSITAPFSALMDRAAKEDALPKTILYSLNANDYIVLLTTMACFQKDIPGKIQLGSGWWFNDTRTGMIEQLTKLSEQGLLSQFVGMLTDSRSFLSYPRHEYFRRILCDLLGGLVERGQAPEDYALLGGIAEDISYNNANTYFGF